MVSSTAPTNWPHELQHRKYQKHQKQEVFLTGANLGKTCTRLSIRGPPTPFRGALSVPLAPKSTQNEVTLIQNQSKNIQNFNINLVCIMVPPTGPTNRPHELQHPKKLQKYQKTSSVSNRCKPR